MKLELKHFVGYPKTLGLLLDAEVYHTLEGIDFNNNTVISERIGYKPEEVIPLLRPLSNIMETITHQGESFVPLDKLKERWPHIIWEDDERALCLYLGGDIQEDGEFIGNIGVWFTHQDWSGELNNFLPKWVWEQLQEWHFDVYDLLFEDLARPYGVITKKD